MELLRAANWLQIIITITILYLVNTEDWRLLSQICKWNYFIYFILYTVILIQGLLRENMIWNGSQICL